MFLVSYILNHPDTDQLRNIHSPRTQSPGTVSCVGFKRLPSIASFPSFSNSSTGRRFPNSHQIKVHRENKTARDIPSFNFFLRPIVPNFSSRDSALEPSFPPAPDPAFVLTGVETDVISWEKIVRRLFLLLLFRSLMLFSLQKSTLSFSERQQDETAMS